MKRPVQCTEQAIGCKTYVVYAATSFLESCNTWIVRYIVRSNLWDGKRTVTTTICNKNTQNLMKPPLQCVEERTRQCAEVTFCPLKMHFVWKQQHFAVRLSPKVSPNTAPSTKTSSNTGPAAPATEGDTPTSSNTAGATKGFNSFLFFIDSSILFSSILLSFYSSLFYSLFVSLLFSTLRFFSLLCFALPFYSWLCHAFLFYSLSPSIFSLLFSTLLCLTLLFFTLLFFII